MFEEERTQAVRIRISPEPHAFGDPLSLGLLCQAMFIEGARVLGYTGEALMPKEVQELVFLAATSIADGLGRLLRNQDDSALTAEGSSTSSDPHRLTVVLSEGLKRGAR